MTKENSIKMSGSLTPDSLEHNAQPKTKLFTPYIKCFNDNQSTLIDTCALYARSDEKPYFELGCLNGEKYKIYFVHKTDKERENFSGIRLSVTNKESTEGEIQFLNYKYLKGIPIYGCPILNIAWTPNPETQKKVYYKISLTLFRMDNTDNPMWLYLFSVFYSDEE